MTYSMPKLSALTLTVVALGLTVPAAQAAPEAPTHDVVDRAAGLLLKAHVSDNELGSGWEWRLGSGRIAPNVSAIVASALLDAHQLSGDAQSLVAAIRFGNHRSARLEAGAAPVWPDVSFLARLGEAAGDARFKRAAQAAFARMAKRSPTGGAEAERIRALRGKKPQIVGFDVSLAIRGALAVGELDYANALAAAVLPDLQRTDHLLPQDASGAVSRAALLGALLQLHSATDASDARLGKTIDQLTDWLVIAQERNGSWYLNVTQVTAYAVQALALSKRPEAQRAAQAGARWLQGTLLPGGRWANFNDGLPEPFVGELLPEIMAEALSALVALNRA